jgi:hypothetical protein
MKNTGTCKTYQVTASLIATHWVIATDHPQCNWNGNGSKRSPGPLQEEFCYFSLDLEDLDNKINLKLES